MGLRIYSETALDVILYINCMLGCVYMGGGLIVIMWGWNKAHKATPLFNHFSNHTRLHPTPTPQKKLHVITSRPLFTLWLSLLAIALPTTTSHQNNSPFKAQPQMLLHL